MLFTIGALATLVASVSAHATWQELWIGGVDFGGSCVRLPLSNSPVTDVTSDDLICNVTPTPSAGICPVAAGSAMTVEMHQQPGDRSCTELAIGGAHYGPIMVYLAKVSNAATSVATGLSWFKIAEIGLVSNNPDYWGNEVLNDNCGHYNFKIPADIPAGNYLMRAETIALHVAGTLGGAQFYMSCYQINVTGGGKSAPATVSFPGAYSATDPGILIDIYQQLNNYTIPGPAPYEFTVPAIATTLWPTAATINTAALPSSDFTTMPGGAATSSVQSTSTVVTTSSSSAKSTSSSTAKSTSTVKSSTTTATTTAPASTSTAAKYGQCGGIGWTGPTVCAAGSTCTVSNAYYSQCL